MLVAHNILCIPDAHKQACTSRPHWRLHIPWVYKLLGKPRQSYWACHIKHIRPVKDHLGSYCMRTFTIRPWPHKAETVESLYKIRSAVVGEIWWFDFKRNICTFAESANLSTSCGHTFLKSAQREGLKQPSRRRQETKRTMRLTLQPPLRYHHILNDQVSIYMCIYVAMCIYIYTYLKH